MKRLVIAVLLVAGLAGGAVAQPTSPTPDPYPWSAPLEEVRLKGK